MIDWWWQLLLPFLMDPITTFPVIKLLLWFGNISAREMIFEFVYVGPHGKKWSLQTLKFKVSKVAEGKAGFYWDLHHTILACGALVNKLC